MPRIRYIINAILLMVALYFLYLMLLITIQYIPIEFDVAFLRIKDAEIRLKYYQVAFFSHVFTSFFVLVFGILQLIPFLKLKLKNFHKTIGLLYVSLILFLSAPSGFVMALHANGGLLAKISFIILSVLWFFYTLKAFLFAKKREWNKHENFMYRSFSLTFSAVSLRLFKYILANTLKMPPMDMYIIVSWLGWIVNLAIAEVIIFHKSKLNSEPVNGTY